jgi:hypothetical protein
MHKNTRQNIREQSKKRRALKHRLKADEPSAGKKSIELRNEDAICC